jgi:hypothetical protein
MDSLYRLVITLALAWVTGAQAELSSYAKEVLAIAPGLHGFADSEANFDSLASGLRLGKRITLTSISSTGTREVLRLTPAASLGASETVNVLEAVRFEFLSLGISEVSARQIGILLVGGTIVTPHGPARVAGLIVPEDPQRPLSLSVHTFAGSPQNYRNLVLALTRGTRVTLVAPGGRVRFAPRGAPLSQDEVRLVLLAASELLAAHGIEDPTPQELLAALVGGTLDLVPAGKAVLPGILEERANSIR